MVRIFLAILMAAGGAIAVVGDSPGRDQDKVPAWVKNLTGTHQNLPEIPWRDSSTASPAVSQIGKPAADPVFPAARRWEVSPSQASPPGVPVDISATEGRAVSLEVLDRAAAQRLGVSGFLFKTSKVDGTSKLTVDYSRFANAFGGDYGARLQLRALPACVLQGCAQPGERVPASNDTTARRLTADVAELDGATVFAVTAGVGGETGTYAATQLSIAGSWQVAPGSGAFSYSYPIDVPKPGAGTAPSVSIGYSSAAIDGLTMASNTQASPVGLGWSDWANAYIERRYEQCYKVHLPDLCWQGDNAVLSLGGMFGPLVAVNAERTQWKLLSDPGWRIERGDFAKYTNIYGNQAWKVTGPDGTQYIFGGGHMPGRQTGSILSVHVLADDDGEPCRPAPGTLGGCNQGWRWYLDRIIDPDGNETAFLYERETNRYSAIRGLGDNVLYHRGAVLKEIIYGGRNWDPATYSARVLFDSYARCYYLHPNCGTNVPPGHGGFPDTPTDLICTSLTKGACAHSPSFFSARFYKFVRTEVKIGGAWEPAAKYEFSHAWGDDALKVANKMRITAIQRIGAAFGKDTRFPATVFGYKELDNRADHSRNTTKAMRHFRISSVTNPFGGVTTVTYFQNRACSPEYKPPNDPDISVIRWDQNVRDCFPQEVKDNDFTGTGIYNKYLVKEVSESDGVTAEAIKTTYSYLGDPAWAYDFSAIQRDQAAIGWSAWRGYGQVDVRKGTSWARITVFRGWNRDHVIQKTGGTGWTLGDRAWSITADDGSTFVDDPALAGRTLEEIQFGTLNTVAGTKMQRRTHRYETRVVNPLPGYRFPVQWVGLASTTESVATAPGLMRDRRSKTTYNASFQPTTTLEEGWLDVSGDERCSITTYADDATRNMFVYPASNKKVAGGCTSTTVLTESATSYDERRNPTVQRTRIDASTWAQTTTEFDVMGRPVKATGPTGAAITTAYTVATGGAATEIPSRTVVTNALGHQQITDYQVEFGTPLRKQDANGNVVAYEYDEFGRTVSVWLPTEAPGSTNPSWRFSYDIPNKAIRSQRLAACCTTVVYEDTWVIYDGMWRERQVQGRSTDGTKALVSETTYDNRGLVRDQTVEQALTGTPGKYIPGGSSWLNRTRHSYDELGREVLNQWFRGANPAHATSTAYTSDTVTVTGPDGRRVRERVDGLGRTIAVEEADGSAWVTSTYTYDLADRMIGATDPAGNKIGYSYNMVGWRTGQTDPNRGTALFGYDLAGLPTAVWTEGDGLVHTNYDALGRPTQRRADNATSGPLLASWQYDTATGGKGKLHKETNASGWVSEVSGYDTRGRPTGTKLVVPPGIAGLSGTYEVKQTYDLADRVRSAQLPAIGGLPAETVTTDYTNLGLLSRIAGLQEYVSAVAYDDRGRRTSAAFGPKPGGAVWMAKQWSFDADQRVNGSQTLIGSTVVSDHQLVIDNSGNLTEATTRQNGLAWRECYGHDSRARLVAAHTVSATTTCAAGAAGTGDRPYRHTYQYSPDGKILSRNENGVSTSYTYPAAGAARPHAPSKVGADTYSWDVEGKLTSRTVAGQTETFAWNKEDRLVSVTRPSGATTFVYDTSGQRLLRRTPDGHSTLYFAGHEVTVNSLGSVVSAVRPYTLDGKVVATRTLTGVDYLVSGPHGSVEMAYPSGSSTPAMTRSYLPYGKVRAETGDTATDRGFLGQIEDTTTKLSYLNDRYYDTRVGVFLSADALFDTSKVKTLNPYTYASGNPAGLADPSGLYSAGDFGTELQNQQLRAMNKELIAHVGRLNHQIAEMQSIIRKQADAINRLLAYAEALEAEIARQASIIRQLQARVAYLQRVVVAQQREIGRLRGIIAYQQGVIRRQAWVIGYYKGVVNQLGFRLWGGTQYHGQVMHSIHSFRGIPSWAFSVDNVSRLQASVYKLNGDLGAMTAERDKWQGRYYGANNTVSHLRANIDELESDLESVQADYQLLIDKTDPQKMSERELMCHYGTSSGSLWHGSASGGTGADALDFIGDSVGIAFQFVPELPAFLNATCDISGING